ncbi:MAG: aminopeptidase [Deltaproteobacteria bacterium]|nr:aminopeptidase [Deltaproteobacteria bacterium]
MRSASRLLVLLLPALTGCRTLYVLRSAWFEAELLSSREPIDRVLAEGRIEGPRADRLRLVPEIRAFADELGLASTRSYTSVALSWDRRILNLSACAPLSFQVATWWFPVVGRVPYLGFFRPQDAEAERVRWEARGYDVWVRPAGAFSTLGWFRDPVLPEMLDWDEARLAETLLHETAHATLWIPGSVSFNETFATVVGEAASLIWMERVHGPDAPGVARLEADRADGRAFEALLLDLYDDLDVVYKNLDESPAARWEARRALYDSLEDRVARASWNDPDRARAAARRGPWNNARLAQYRTYHLARDGFDVLLARAGGDISAFVDAVRQVVDGARDPWKALAAATETAVPLSDR